MRMRYEDFQYLRFDRPEPGVLLITLNRPDKLNAVTARMHDELGEIWLTIAKDPSVHVAVVTGAGRAFCVGGDLAEGQDSVGNIEPIIESGEFALKIVYNMINCDKPIISAINGPAAGAGLAVALSADISIISEDTFVTDAHTRIGVASGDHAVMLWPLFCGMPKAKLYLLTADRVSGPEAERIGLVSRCVPAADVLPEALALAGRLSKMSQMPLRWTKRCLNHWLRQAGPMFDLSVAYEGLNFMQEDAKEAGQAFLEKREPVFAAPGQAAGTTHEGAR